VIATAGADSSGGQALLIAGLLVPMIVAYISHRRGPSENRDAQYARLAAERDSARRELHEDNTDLRSRLDALEAEMAAVKAENVRLRGIELLQGARITQLERALEQANIPIPEPPKWPGPGAGPYQNSTP